MPGVDHAADGGPVHHGHVGLPLLTGADVLDGILPVLAVHVHLEGEHDHGDGQPGQRNDEHTAQGVQSDSCKGALRVGKFRIGCVD